MRRMTFGIAMALLVACGGCSEMMGIQNNTGTLVFTLDANSCSPGSGDITFYVDGSAVGTATLSPGLSSPSYTVSAGQHFASAGTAHGYDWPSRSFTVEAGGRFTYLLLCG